MSDLRSTEQIDERRDELKRVMGPGLLLLFIVGDILGTGIYALTGTVAKEVGGMIAYLLEPGQGRKNNALALYAVHFV